jgi:hypothetical protein
LGQDPNHLSSIAEHFAVPESQKQLSTSKQTEAIPGSGLFLPQAIIAPPVPLGFWPYF